MAGLDWTMDSAYAGEGGFDVIPDGVWAFKVTSFKRSRTKPTSKWGDIPQAELTYSVSDASGTYLGSMSDRFPLDEDMLWKIGAFFRAIGAEKNADGSYHVAWNDDLVGREFIARTEQSTFVGSDGKERKTCDVKRYFAPGEAPSVSVAPTEQAVAAAFQSSGVGF